MTYRGSALILATTIGLLGCDGGQSGGELGLDGGGGGAAADEGAGCDETKTELGLDDPTPLGFAAAEILAFAAGPHEATMTYSPDAQTGSAVQLTPAGENTELTIVIEPKSTASFVDSEPAEQGSDGSLMDIASACSDYVEIGVTATIATTDGAFDETLDGTLIARGATQATLSVPLDLEALDGTFAVEVLEPEGGDPVQTSVEAILGTGVFAGQISGMVELIGPDVAQSGMITYGRWGYGDCETGRVPVTGEDGPTPSALLDAVNGATPLVMTWGDGTATELNLAATSSDSLCLELADPALDLPGGRYFLAGELALDTSDGRLDTTQSISIEATATDSAFDTLLVTFASLAFTDSTDFESTYGLTGVDLGDHTDISLLLQLDYELSTQPATVDGALSVVGIPPTDCVPTPNSSCGSPGQQPIEVAPISGP